MKLNKPLYLFALAALPLACGRALPGFFSKSNEIEDEAARLLPKLNELRQGHPASGNVMLAPQRAHEPWSEPAPLEDIRILVDGTQQEYSSLLTGNKLALVFTQQLAEQELDLALRQEKSAETVARLCDGVERARAARIKELRKTAYSLAARSPRLWSASHKLKAIDMWLDDYVRGHRVAQVGPQVIAEQVLKAFQTVSSYTTDAIGEASRLVDASTNRAPHLFEFAKERSEDARIVAQLYEKVFEKVQRNVPGFKDLLQQESHAAGESSSSF